MHLLRIALPGLLLASVGHFSLAQASSSHADPCAPVGTLAPLLTLDDDGGVLVASLSYAPPNGKAFLIARVDSNPPQPAPRSGLPGCAGVASGVLMECLDVDGTGRVETALSGGWLLYHPVISVVVLPAGGTLADTALSNSVAVQDEIGDVFYQSGEILITEVMKDPSAVSDTQGEWLELHNPGPVDVDIEGWSLSDYGSNQHQLFRDWTGIVVPAGGYLVLGRNADGQANGGVAVDYEYSSFTLGNTEDEIVLRRANGVQVDVLDYDDAAGWPDAAGASMALNPFVLDAVLADDAANWCAGQSEWLPGGDRGTPGELNEVCP